MTVKPNFMDDANELLKDLRNSVDDLRDSEEEFIVLQCDLNRLILTKMRKKDCDYIKIQFQMCLSELIERLKKIKSRYETVRN